MGIPNNIVNLLRSVHMQIHSRCEKAYTTCSINVSSLSYHAQVSSPPVSTTVSNPFELGFSPRTESYISRNISSPYQRAHNCCALPTSLSCTHAFTYLFMADSSTPVGLPASVDVGVEPTDVLIDMSNPFSAPQPKISLRRSNSFTLPNVRKSCPLTHTYSLPQI